MPRTRTKIKLPPDVKELLKSRRDLFDLPPCELHENIGRWGIQQNRRSLADFQVSQVIAVQRAGQEKLNYRVLHGTSSSAVSTNVEWLSTLPELSEVVWQLGDEPIKQCGPDVRLSMRSSQTVRTCDVETFCALATRPAAGEVIGVHIVSVRPTGLPH